MFGPFEFFCRSFPNTSSFMQSISILVLCLIAHVSIEIPRCKWFSLGPTSKLLYFPSLPLLLYVPAWPLPILHMLEKQSCQLYCPTTSDWYCHQPSTHSKNPILWSIFLLFYSNIRTKWQMYFKAMIVSMIKLTAPLKAIIIWSSTTALVWTGLIGVLKEVWNCYLQTINFTHH